MPTLHGTQHYAARLTDIDVRQIRHDYEPGRATYAALASRYGVGKQAIHKVITRATWKHL